MAFQKGDRVKIKPEHRKDYEHLEISSGFGKVVAKGPQGVKVKFKDGMPGWVAEAHLESRG